MSISDTAARNPRAWTASTLDPPENWYYRLSNDSIRALESAAPAPLAAPSPDLVDQLRADLAPIRTALEQGRGFAIQEGLNLSRYSTEEAAALYWHIGRCLGRPVPQNVQGTVLYDVRDTGQTVQSGARFSVTNADSSFHTDNSFGAQVTDYVGLLSFRAAHRGGVNQLVSGWTAYQHLSREQPEALAVLTLPFPVDRRGGTREGEAPVIHRPVIEIRGEEPLYRYLRYWIEAGATKSTPLTGPQTHALDRLDQTLRRPDLRAEFSLQPGQILWVNNRWILHSRTAFQDHPEPELRRHLIRLWLEA